MQIHHARRARGLGVAVGNGNGGQFLESEDVLNAALVDHGVADRQFRGSRIAEQIPDAAAGEHFENNFYAVHDLGSEGLGIGIISFQLSVYSDQRLEVS